MIPVSFSALLVAGLSALLIREKKCVWSWVIDRCQSEPSWCFLIARENSAWPTWSVCCSYCKLGLKVQSLVSIDGSSSRHIRICLGICISLLETETSITWWTEDILFQETDQPWKLFRICECQIQTNSEKFLRNLAVPSRSVVVGAWARYHPSFTSVANAIYSALRGSDQNAAGFRLRSWVGRRKLDRPRAITLLSSCKAKKKTCKAKSLKGITLGINYQGLLVQLHRCSLDEGRHFVLIQGTPTFDWLCMQQCTHHLHLHRLNLFGRRPVQTFR